MKKNILILIGILLFLANTAFGYSMPRWGMTAVDVYIPENQYSNIVQRTFNEWSQASNGKMRFRFNSTRFASNNAPIKVSFIDAKAPYYLVITRRMETTGYFTNMDYGFINRATIQIYLKDKNNDPIKTEDLYNELIPGIGYILGLNRIYGDCENLNPPTAMCLKNGYKPVITDNDRKLIQEKYTRSSDDIKEQKLKSN